jgi:DNA-binding response OmpR family regulator
MIQKQVNISPCEGEEETPMKILVIDDDNDILASLQYALRSYGLEVTPCENGAQAMMRVMMDKFDIIITDFNMPGMDGLELTSYLRARFPEIIIIGMSARDVSVPFLVSGANDFLLKPFVPYRLAMMITGDDILS